MAGALLDIYGNYDRAMQEYDRLANAYNDIYYAGDYANLPERPVEPIQPPGETYTATLGEVLPQDLYQSVFGKATPDTLTNEAWSLQNISSPFMSSASDTAYDLGQINRMNNPLYYASPDLLTQGQQAYNPEGMMYNQSSYT